VLVEKNMNAIPSERVRREEDTEVVHEVDEGVVEVGTVSETKGGFVGHLPDNGTAGYVFI
jgi:hypothetical protein